jgi:chemotaxis protein MotB
VSNGPTKSIAIFMTVAALTAAGFAYLTSRQAEKQLTAQRGVAEKCRVDLGACTGDRETKDKAASEASANLNASRAELDELRAEHAEAEKRLASFKALTEKFQKMIDSGKLQIVLRHGRMVVKLPAGVLFASGSAELSKEGKTALHEVATILRQVHDRHFMIAGHTDNMPIDPRAVPPSPFKNNLELSTARALTVAQQLITSGMNPTRLVAAGYAEHEPVRENSSDAGRQENRRIEIVLMPNVTEIPGLDAGAVASPAGAGGGGGAKPVDAGKPIEAGAKP